MLTIKTVTLRLEDEVHKELKLKVIQEDTNMQSFITELIKKALEEK